MSFGFLMPPGFPGPNEIARVASPTRVTSADGSLSDVYEFPIGTIISAKNRPMTLDGEYVCPDSYVGNQYYEWQSIGSIIDCNAITDGVICLQIDDNGRPLSAFLAKGVGANAYIRGGKWMCLGLCGVVRDTGTINVGGVGTFTLNDFYYLYQRIS